MVVEKMGTVSGLTPVARTCTAGQNCLTCYRIQLSSMGIVKITTFRRGDVMYFNSYNELKTQILQARCSHNYITIIKFPIIDGYGRVYQTCTKCSKTYHTMSFQFVDRLLFSVFMNIFRKDLEFNYENLTIEKIHK